MQNFDLKKVMEMLSTMLRCPICSTKYGKENTRVIESEQDPNFGDAFILIHSDCKKCKSSIVFNVEIRGPEVFSVGMVTDLTQSDTIKFRKYDPITSTEVLDLHKNLKKFKGDFVKAFVSKP